MPTLEHSRPKNTRHVLATWRAGLHTFLYMLVTLVISVPVGTVSSQPAIPTQALAQVPSRTNVETGKTIRGTFLAEWDRLGGLPQHGYPISDELEELSAIDGKSYTVQYFERSVFELHPENQPPYDVLLQLLGTSTYRERYPEGAPNQQPSGDPTAQGFVETGKWLGGRFLQYWQETGGLMRHGYPLSDEFEEVSPLDGKTYSVQYFERSVFEFHPENIAPYDVLLSHLGTFARQRSLPDDPRAPMGDWDLWDPMDPSAPVLMQPGDKGYRLAQSWDVARIEFTYRWTGLGGDTLNYQKVEKQGSGYVRNGEAVPGELVLSFLNSLDHFYVTPGTAFSPSGTDNYPYLALEIVGVDGSHIFLSSISNIIPGNVPWNLYYNGRAYAQYDGFLAEPLFRLFPVNDRTSVPAPSGTIAVNAQTFYPDQITSGYWGFFPFPDSFAYEVDNAQGLIKGHLTPHSFTLDGLGKINDLLKVELTVDGRQIACRIDREETNGWWLYWDFTCLPGDIATGLTYSFPLTAYIGTDAGHEMIVTGELWGAWGAERGYLKVPVGQELTDPIAANPHLPDLLRDHMILHTAYEGTLRPNNPMAGTRSGTMTLVGTTRLAGKPLRYTIGTRFIVEEGQLTYWTLDRPALEALVQDVAMLPTTQRLLATNPDLLLNLWYAADPLPPTRRTEAYLVKVNPCGGIPGGVFPTVGKPLRAFDFSRYNPQGVDIGIGLSKPQEGFVFIDDEPVVWSLNVNPAEGDPIGTELLPQVFDTGDARPFEHVWLSAEPPLRQENLIDGQIVLTLRTLVDPTDEEKRIYARIANSLPGKVTSTLSYGNELTWEMQELTFAMLANGELSVVGCQR